MYSMWTAPSDRDYYDPHGELDAAEPEEDQAEWFDADVYLDLDLEDLWAAAPIGEAPYMPVRYPEAA